MAEELKEQESQELPKVGEQQDDLRPITALETLEKQLAVSEKECEDLRHTIESIKRYDSDTQKVFNKSMKLLEQFHFRPF
jgi:hypothetical protein